MFLKIGEHISGTLQRIYNFIMGRPVSSPFTFCVKKIKIELGIMGYKDCILYKRKKRRKIYFYILTVAYHRIANMCKFYHGLRNLHMGIKHMVPLGNDARFRKLNSTNFHYSGVTGTKPSCFSIKSCKDCTVLVKTVQFSKIF